MPDLREQLAEKFANIFLPRLGDGTPYSGLMAFQKQEWRKLADECIRQMEWAWNQGYTAAECDQAQAIYEDSYFRHAVRFDDISGAEEYPLYAAPDDWNPNMPRTIDVSEDNFGLGDHRGWSKKDREAWHAWYERTMGEPYPMQGCCDYKESDK